MFVIRLGILLLHVLRATTFSGNFAVNSDKGNGVKYHVEGKFSNIKTESYSPYVKIFVAGTFSADIVLPSDGIYLDRQMTSNKILSDSDPETETEAEPEPESEEPQPEPVLACRCGIELPKKLKIVGGTEVLRVGFT